MNGELLTYVLSIAVPVIGYFLRQKDELQAAQIKLLFEKHDADAKELQELRVRIAKQQLITSVTQATQQRLDDFARQRNYDGILSACTYATSAVPKFAAEGQYCVTARDATWATLYAIMAEIEAGARTMPTGYSGIELDLPPLVWPT